MFAFFLGFLRLALCASALALLGVGAQAGRVETSLARETPDWGAMKRVKSFLVAGPRAGAACPLAAAAQAGGARVAGPGTVRGEAFGEFLDARGFVAPVFGAAIRDPERERGPARRTIRGVVRLLI